MLLVTELLVLAFVAAVWAPDTPLGKNLRTVLIEAPAQALKRATPLKIIVGLIVFLGLVAFVLGAPEIVAMIGLGDLSIYLDFTVVVILLSVVARLKSTVIHTVGLSRAVVARVIARANRTKARNRRPRMSRPKLPSSTDENAPHWAWAFA